MLQLGIVGLPNVGKSTLFNALTNAGAEASNYQFCTVEPNVGVVAVPDQRVEVLAKIVQPEKATPARVEFVDIAGLVRGASRGEGLGNQFLARIREVDALVHVVRCFEDETVAHPEGTVDATRDIEIVNTELVLADLATVDRRRTKLTAQAKRGVKDAHGELETLDKLFEHLDTGLPAATVELPEHGLPFLKELNLLTSKPVIYVANISDELASRYEDSSWFRDMQSHAGQRAAEVVPICSKLEAELAELPADEAKEFLDELGLEGSGLNRLIQQGYKLLELITFFTIKPPEVRAWPILAGTKAPEAAGKVHTDMQRGFIKAEVVSYEDLSRTESLQSVREKGLMRLEGKDYQMKDGDVVLFKFSPPK